MSKENQTQQEILEEKTLDGIGATLRKLIAEKNKESVEIQNEHNTIGSKK